jgi:multicomponent Na+:H+ antiporter subunit G
MNGETISIILDLLATLFLLGGLFFMVIGVLGLHRFPDCYGKLHAVTKCATLGLLGMLLATILHIGVISVMTKAIMTIVFVFIANPVGSHMIAKAAHHCGYRKWEKTLSDDLEEDKAAGKLGQRAETGRNAEFAGANEEVAGDPDSDPEDDADREPALREAM